MVNGLWHKRNHFRFVKIIFEEVCKFGNIILKSLLLRKDFAIKNKKKKQEKTFKI